MFTHNGPWLPVKLLKSILLSLSWDRENWTCFCIGVSRVNLRVNIPLEGVKIPKRVDLAVLQGDRGDLSYQNWEEVLRGRILCMGISFLSLVDPSTGETIIARIQVSHLHLRGEAYIFSEKSSWTKVIFNYSLPVHGASLTNFQPFCLYKLKHSFSGGQDISDLTWEPTEIY